MLGLSKILLKHQFLLLFLTLDYYDYNNMTNTNTIVQDHRRLHEWSLANNGSNITLPVDMVFNDGHRLSIIVYR